MNKDTKKKIDYIDKALNKSKDYFLTEFAKLICGDNEASVYKNCNYIEKFFNYLEYPLVGGINIPEYERLEINEYIEYILIQMKPKDLYRIFLGLISKELHIKIDLAEPDSDAITTEFRKILRISLQDDGIPKFSDDRILDINQEKLQDNNDDYLDSLLDDSEGFYANDQKKEAINSIYDAFERIKTHYDNDKKTSTATLIEKLSQNTGIDTVFFDNLFKQFNSFCNSYNIRHYDNKVKILQNSSYDYIYNDMLNFLNLIINVINKEK